MTTKNEEQLEMSGYFQLLAGCQWHMYIYKQRTDMQDAALGQAGVRNAGHLVWKKVKSPARHMQSTPRRQHVLPASLGIVDTTPSRPTSPLQPTRLRTGPYRSCRGFLTCAGGNLPVDRKRPPLS